VEELNCDGLRLLVQPEAMKVERVGDDLIAVDPASGSRLGRLDFGTWERIFYGEFDGRRRKRVLVKIIGE